MLVLLVKGVGMGGGQGAGGGQQPTSFLPLIGVGQ